MPRTTERLPLQSPSPGQTQELIVHRYGAADASPKAYLQASLHADETPGMMVLHHLIPLLDAAEAEGRLRGQIVVVPYANPIGLGQVVNQLQLGRFALNGGGNFNRNWPDLYALAAENLEGRLGRDPVQNVATVRSVLRSALAGQAPPRTLDGLRLALARLAVDADIVLDLHCDDEALMHSYQLPQHWPEGRDLAAELGCRAVLLAEDSGGASFDEAFSTPWVKLSQRFPDVPIPSACFAVTLELRGRADVSDELGHQDAAALVRFLRRRGVLASDEPEPPLPDLPCEATPLDACDVVRAPAAGILSYRVALGDRVEQGDTIAWLIDPASEDPEQGRQAILSGTSGLVFTLCAHKYVSPGDTIAKVAGMEPLASREAGNLLED